MDTADLIARLAQHRTVGSAPVSELAWLAAHGHLRRVEVGQTVTQDQEAVESMSIVLSGHVSISVDRGLGPHKVMEWGPGDVTGALPYSRMGKPPGDAVADEAGDMFRVHRSHFPEMIRECPTVTTILVHLMLDRVRRFTSSDLQDEKMMSLGRLSAGLAHELNNPASAAARSTRLLAEGLTRLEDTSRRLGAARLTDVQLAAVNRARQLCSSAAPSMLSPIERADREDALSVWLEQHGADPDAEAALVDTALTFDDLDSLASTLDGEVLNLALRWLAADCSSRTLAAEVEKAATRIHDLVAAVKRFTYMDRTQVPEAVDLTTSLNDSLALLMHKARKKSASVSVTMEPNLPRVRAIGGDLNQVWMNLVDNALDAVGELGHVTVNAARYLDFVRVSIVDDGPGIPEELRERIFDQFFTTKPVGQGTGLGLDIARRLIGRNEGQIDLESRPGRTVFRVTLPVAHMAVGAPAPET